MEIKKKLFKEDSLEFSNLYNFIGACYNDDLKYHESLEYYQKALEIREKLGDVSTDTATIYDNLGTLNANFSKLEIALEYFNKGLDVKKKLYDNYNVNIAHSYSKRAFTLI